MATKSPTKTRQEHGQPPPQSPEANFGFDIDAGFGFQPVRRPVIIDQDVNDLGQRRRVSNVLTSPMFKEELETVVTDLLRSGDGGGHVIAREIANMLSPHSLGRSTLNLKTGVGCVCPISDITGSGASQYTKGEKLARCKLAALYRLVDLHGWSMQIYNHISYRVDKEQEHFLINPFGLMYHEVSASKLLKINMQGDVIDQGSTNFPVNKAGFTIHSAIHSGRPDLNCVIHVHVPEVIAVSLMDCGLLPISQEACIVGEVSQHPYNGIVVDPKEKKLLIKHLGPTNKVMLLRNHGLLACGETIEEAFHLLVNMIYACKTQLKVLSCVKLEKINILDKSVRNKVQELVKTGGERMDNKDDPIKWGIGEMMFEAYMRMLDNIGYRTGYSYKIPTTIQRRRTKGEVEIPATAHGHTIPLDEIQEGRARLQSHPPSRWINSPNQYTKVRPISQEGSSDPNSVNGDMSPKNKAKWMSGGGSGHGTPIRIADPNQFVPKNTDPREVAVIRKQIRGQGRMDEKGPGPQSQKLEGVLPADRRGQYQCFIDSPRSSAYDFLEIGTIRDEDEVFTASKGIIQRDYHKQTVVAGPPNPFASISDDEIEKYRLEVTQKVAGQPEAEAHVVMNEEAVEHTIEVVAHVNEEPVAENQQIPLEQPPQEVMTNGHSEPEEIVVEEATEIVVDLKQTENQEQVEEQEPEPVNDDVPLEEPKIESRPPPKEPSPVENNKHEEPPKENGGKTPPTLAPKAVEETEAPVKQPPVENKTEKNENKSKHKESKTKEHKKGKRRSLSFLKKNKDKKEKE